MAKKIKGLLTRRDEFSFIPSFEEDRKQLFKIPIGGQVSYNISDTRSVGYHRRYFKTINIVLDMMPEQYHKIYPANKPLRLIRKIQEILEMGESYVDEHGISHFEHDSISFAGMGQKRFEEFYKSSCDVILSSWLRHITLQQFNNKLQGLM
uniref:Uncharacterized protein n=1 Tax=uncultured marine virus TaxID=186617 RepID=A0A0F7L6I4_9VIRU|nr:hypothetical protein [uncultured marine virus]